MLQVKWMIIYMKTNNVNCMVTAWSPNHVSQFTIHILRFDRIEVSVLMVHDLFVVVIATAATATGIY